MRHQWRMRHRLATPGLKPERFETSDGVEYSTSKVRVLILKNVLEYEYRKKVRVQVLLQI